MGPILDTTASLAAEIRLAAGDVATGFTLGGVVGTVVAHRRVQRGTDINPFVIVARWSIVGGVALPVMLLLAR